MSESRKKFEERLLTEMLYEIRPECLCNILSYAAEYLRGRITSTDDRARTADLNRADIMDKYADKMATRNREVRE